MPEETKKPEIVLSQDQEAALEKMRIWWEWISNKENKVNTGGTASQALRIQHEWKNKQVFYLTGYAGTGKTTLISFFRDKFIKSSCIIHAAFTGKAALQMSRAGCPGARTIHSLIYRLADDSGKELVWELNQDSDLIDARLLILDECSMVSKEIGEDLLSFNVPILVLGDPGQLPPISGTGFFTNRVADSKLTQVHRQALNNPIIAFATDIRSGKGLGRRDLDQLQVYSNSKNSLSEYDQILVGYNKTRIKINERSRAALGFINSKIPVKGDKIICTRNNARAGLFNGTMGIVTEDSISEDGIVKLSFDSTEGRHYKDVLVHAECFEPNREELLKRLPNMERFQLNEFDYGYAITVHKAQGSQWDSVLLLDDSFLCWDREERRRWLYTAVTRAAEEYLTT